MASLEEIMGRRAQHKKLLAAQEAEKADIWDAAFAEGAAVASAEWLCSERCGSPSGNCPTEDGSCIRTLVQTTNPYRTEEKPA